MDNTYSIIETGFILIKVDSDKRCFLLPGLLKPDFS